MVLHVLIESMITNANVPVITQENSAKLHL